MISIMFLAVLLDRPALSVRNVALGALAITALAPESLLEVGFQMSFAAVLALVAAYEAIRAPDDQQRGSGGSWGLRGTVLFFGGIVLATLVASAAVAPFAAYHFHKSQQYAVIANLIAIPVCNVFVMPAALATLVLMPLGLEAGPLWLMGQGIGMMVWCAETVARIPGAVAHIPAIPTASFALMVAGGLWLCLWRTRWRLLGLAVIAAGIAIAPMQTRPDILVGRDGSLLAARVDGEELSAIAGGGASFELQRWLDSDGDARNPRSVTSTDRFRCDALGCTAKVKGVVVSLAREPAALADDCARAGILVLTFPRPRGCRPAGLAIDFFDMHRKGTHAIYLGDGTIRMETVGDARGDRPWTRAGPRPSRSTQPASPTGRSPAEPRDARSDGSGASGTDADADEPQ
jgi:competence protein ComEC